MRIHNQPVDGAFANTIIDWLENFTGTFYGISAFAKNSGVLMLEKSLNEFRKNGGKIIFVVGIDLNGTSVEALKNLLRLSDELYIVHSENTITFHSKIYSLTQNNYWNIAIGSNNFTKGGFFNNYESSYVIENISNNHNLATDIIKIINIYTNTNTIDKTVMKINSIKEIEELKNNNYIYDEKEIQMKIIRDKSVKYNKNKNKLFGKSSYITPNQPKKPNQINVKPISNKNIPTTLNDIFWFEAGNLTGGSRNILDLSKTGKLHYGDAINTDYYFNDTLVKGGVRFFDLDPMTPNTKDITINYDGDNYFPATIKYTAGNSNWRLQIKGKNKIDENITSKLSTKMIGQIILFEKISTDHFILNIVPINELANLQQNSLFWATNGHGNKGRKFGYILKELEE
ncbi:restriction endonuclease PLD domain-containing protein [Macrococcoides bohemicum]|uniref:restriction endonuclease PLD domain-containing protein n=1 Tax=Macrococcoides bohemicum TaxID=1903056 RepID=UPI00165DC995|nr:phospholipase D family protein [Macrococcus bohemicus]MBC9873541.1 hypothetical protein [Macrococcus bohemicus]